MALITIKKSTNTAIPTGLANGELAYSSNGDVLFIGANGDGGHPIAGLRVPGINTPNQALVTNSTGYVDTIKAANVQTAQFTLNGFIISTFSNNANATVLGQNTNTDISTSWAVKNYVDAKAAATTVDGVLVDAYRLSGDTDDTASLIAAINTGKPVIFGPKTYIINNFVQPSATNVVLIGTPGASILQRTSASGGDFFKLTANNVYLYGLTFDMNSTAVTANQWGVRVVTQSGNVKQSNIERCVFKNNNGLLGSGLVYYGDGPALTQRHSVVDCEVANTTWQGIYVGSSSNIEIDNTWVHDNTGGAIFATAVGTANSTNYSTNVRVKGCRVERNAGAVGFGGHTFPYDTSTLVACTYSGVDSSTFIDNTGTAISMFGDHITVNDCVITLSAGVNAYNALLGFGRYLSIKGSKIDYSLAGTLSDGVCDFGGCIEAEFVNNKIHAPMGAAINIGGSLNCLVQDNSITMSGTADGVVVQRREGDGNGHGFPNDVENLVIKSNIFTWKTGNGACIGIKMNNGAGVKTGGAAGITIVNNDFNDSPGISAYIQNRIVSYGAGYTCQGNRVNQTSRMYADPNANGVVVHYEVYDEISGLGSSNPLKSIQPYWFSVLIGVVTRVAVSGGTGYNPNTTNVVFSTTGNAGTIPTAHCLFHANGTPNFISMDNIGTFNTTVTAALVDSSGNGSGAVCTVTTGSVSPVQKRIVFVQSVSIQAGTSLGQHAVYTPSVVYRLRPYQQVDLQYDFYWKTTLPRPIRFTRVVTAAGNVAVTTADDLVIVNKTSGANTTVTLPASPLTNDYYTIKDGKGDAYTNPITIVPSSGTIDGQSNVVIWNNYESLDFVYNGTEWNII